MDCLTCFVVVAAIHGNIEMLRWARENGPDRLTFYHLATTWSVERGPCLDQ